MKKRILGAVLLVWGIAIAPMLYHSAKYDGEMTTLALIVGGAICITWIGLGVWLLWPKKRQAMYDYYERRP